MNFKLLKSLTTIGLGLALSSVFGNSVKAETIATAKSTYDMKLVHPLMISQVRGHDLHSGGEQMPCDGIIGHMVCRSGTIGFIRTADGGHLHANTQAWNGEDVLLGRDEDGNYFIIGMAHPRWITKLVADYGFTYPENCDYVPLVERTSSLWAQLGQQRPATTQIPPRPTPPARPYTPPPQPQTQPEPVRGLW